MKQPPTPEKPACPILESTTKITSLSQDLTKSIRQLKREIQYCDDCPAYENCIILKDFNTTISAAIQEISDEWDLAAQAAIRRS